MPTIPNVVIELQKLLNQQEPDIQRVSSAIAEDPAIAGMVLKAVNSARYGLAREIGAKGVLGQALLDLARLRDASGDAPAAGAALEEAEEVLEACQATGYLEEVRRAKAVLVA